MIDLYGLADSLTQAVNPFRSAILRAYVGERKDGADIVPVYRDVAIEVDVQSLSGSDLQHVADLSQTSEMRAVYLRGQASPFSQARGYGGDLIIFDNQIWLVTQLLEEWGNGEWRKVLVTLQKDKA